MATQTPTTYLITGASRGLGRGLVAAYLARPNNTVIAAVRDLTSPPSKSLQELPKGTSTSLIVVKIDSLSETDPQDAVAQLKSEHNITTLDVVIANAGIAKIFPLVSDSKVEDYLEHYRTNVIGTVLLYQAILPLLKNSAMSPKFVTMGSNAGSITMIEHVPIPNAVYGSSKAALNYVTQKIHAENPEIIAFPVHPGFVCQFHSFFLPNCQYTNRMNQVQTEGGNAAANFFGLEKAQMTVEESIAAMVKLVSFQDPF
jgi:norsolorinic acid ketoreductase